MFKVGDIVQFCGDAGSVIECDLANHRVLIDWRDMPMWKPRWCWIGNVKLITEDAKA